jgi:hypothetical protein
VTEQAFRGFREVADWPLLLVGPMVRRVTRTDAWVFIATKEPCTARLYVGAGPAETGAAASAQPQVDLRSIGEHLHVGLLHASLPDPEPDKVYGYDVELRLGDGTIYTLESMELLGDTAETPQPSTTVERHVPLGYTPGMLPSFVTPPASPLDLRLAHASCRKPHGNVETLEPDALPIVDELIGTSLRARPWFVDDGQRVWLDAFGNEREPPDFPPEDLRVRPHQLILTGDQIYADDVAPGLLATCTDAAGKLLGWTEFPPGITPNLNEFLVQPGWRTRYLSLPGVKERVAVGDDDYPQSHLLTFGEWCAMYLLAWSPALWPRTADGSGVALPPPEARLPVKEGIEVLEWVAWFFPQSRVGTRVTQADKALTAAKQVDAFEENIADIWEESVGKAEHFGATVPYVRRVLANVATYTMFDDHEVTDDWYVDRDVADRLLGKNQPDTAWWTAHVGPRILRNGLSAYAIFQHWGNQPDDFAGWDTKQSIHRGSVGQRLLTLWQPGADADELPGGGDGTDPDAPPGRNPVPAGSGARPPLAGPEEDFDLLMHLIENNPWWLHLQSADDPAMSDAEKLALSTQWTRREWTPDDHTLLAQELLRVNDYPTTDTGHYPGSENPADRDGFGRFRWDYAIAFDSHRLIALDTRTWRQFPTAVTGLLPLSSLSPHDPAEARALTTTLFTEYAQAWRDATAPAAKAYGRLLGTLDAVLNGTGSTLDAALEAVADDLEALIGAVSGSIVTSLAISAALEEYRAEIRLEAEFTARFTLDTDDSKMWRVVALLQAVSDAYSDGDTSSYTEPIVRIFLALARYAEAVAGASPRNAIHALHRVLWDAGRALVTAEAPGFPINPGDPDQLLPVIDSLTLQLVEALDPFDIHDRSNVFFRDGSGYLAPELISAPALQWMLTEPLESVGPLLETVILSPAPIFADDAVDFVQRGLVVFATALGQAGPEVWEFESWTANPVGFDNLVVAGRSLDHAVVLSGDVHYAYSCVNNVTLPAVGIDTCYVQLTSSPAKNTEPMTKRIGAAADLLWKSDGRFKLSTFSPRPLLREPWTYWDPDGNGESISDHPEVAASLGGWFAEALQAALEDAARKFHLDDLALMTKEYFQARGPYETVLWHWRWFYAPSGRAAWHLTTNFPRYVVKAFEYLRDAPRNTFGAWWHEALWWDISFARHMEELVDDPAQKIFGHYLYSRDVLLQQVSDAYRAIGVDPYYGVHVDKQQLRDVRGDRMLHYGARERFADEPNNTYVYGHLQEVQVVGHANVGVVQFVEDAMANRLGVRHDILFYPFDDDPRDTPPLAGPWGLRDKVEPGSVLDRPYPRVDWMGSQQMGWFTYPKVCPLLIQDGVIPEPTPPVVSEPPPNTT